MYSVALTLYSQIPDLYSAQGGCATYESICTRAPTVAFGFGAASARISLGRTLEPFLRTLEPSNPRTVEPSNLEGLYNDSMHPWHDSYVDGAMVATAFPVVIEIPKGSKNKYELDKETGLLRLDRVLYSAVH